MSAPAINTRRHAREAAFRVAYQADIAGDSYPLAWHSRAADETLNDDQRALVEDLVTLLETRAPEVDTMIREAAEHWPLQRLAATDRAVLRTAVAELLAHPGTPAPIVIDEAIEIARRFGSEESGRFVNGVLDRIARRLRPEEI